MSVAQAKSARRKIALRYKNPRSFLSVAQSIERERARAAREMAAKKKKSK
jgi:hypothetical protein